MSLSFEDSLKNNKDVTPVINEEINIVNENIEPTSVMAYSMRSVPMLLNDGETWNKVNNSSYLYYEDEYKDDNFSVVDENKNIVLNQNQINITQEQNSQYIPFKMPRRYDGFDLINTTISIYYVNKNNQYGEDYPVDVYYNDDTIKFAWLVSDKATIVSGVLRFEIHAKGKNNKGNTYIWKTKSIANLNVIQSLEEVAGDMISITKEEADNLYNTINILVSNFHDDLNKANNVLKEANTKLGEILDGVHDEVVNVFNQEVGAKVESAVTEKFKNYYTKDETYNRETIDQKINDVKPTGYATEQFVKDNLGELTDRDNSSKTLTVKEYVKQEVDNVDISDKIGELDEYETVRDYVDAAVDGVDISDRLGDLGVNKDEETGNEIPKTVKQYVDEAVDAVDISDQLGELDGKTVKEYVDDAVDDVDLSDYYNKKAIDDKISPIVSDVNTNKNSITTINAAITGINETLESVDTTPNAYYVTTYGDPYTVEGVEYDGKNTLVLYKTNEADDAEARSYVTAHVIEGGGGGAASVNKLVAKRVSPVSYIVSSKDRIVIEYEYEGTNAANEDILLGYATWKLGSKTIINKQEIKTSINMPEGKNAIDVTDYINVGSNQKLTLIITDDMGSTPATTYWYVSVVDVQLNADSFNDKRYYTANEPVNFEFIPYGAVDKTVHFSFIDSAGKEHPLGTKLSSKSAAGFLDGYTIPAQGHGSYLLKVYMTAEFDSGTVYSDKVFKDILFRDEASDAPLIGTIYQNFTARQHDATNIEYTVYDPSTENPTVEIAVDGEVVSTPILETATNLYTFKTDVVGEHIITITCGETVKTLKANITKLDIDITPVTSKLAFDFNPLGKSNNNDSDKNWSDGLVAMSVSDNFDWVNGGYQYDENGDQYFCVKSGTTATINYNLFADDAKTEGKEFKVVFKTTNIKNRDTTFISCMNSGIGLDMKVQDANVYSSNGSLYSPYCEEDIIEFEFNINTIDNIPLVMTYEDGVGCRPMIYNSDSSFWQTTPQPITIGSENCDVHIYRMKAYSRSLSDSEILSNFILDARNAEEMVDRYNRNQIYENKDGFKVLTPESLAEACPDLRVIVVDAPWFTSDKDDKVVNTTVTMIYKNGRPEDNWTCTGALHSGQGTSSNEYGYAGRNIDLIMNEDSSLFKWIGEDGKEVESKTITLTETSVPTNYLNVKVNIASSENQNNAQMARRYNEYNPFVRAAKFNDSKVKDCMEFYNCVIFVRENNTDIATHREFQDCETHFYALGNVGDSKKTDNSRVNDKNDPKECIVEILDYNVPLAEFPTGNGNNICSPSDWKAGNTAYDLLYAPYETKDGKFKSFGTKSYEFRYEMKGISEVQRQANIDAWRDMYRFVVTSTNEEFHSRLKEYFVVDSALYYYLFTERYTMVDNRAKNSFWHYGKVYITESEATALGDKAGGFTVDNEQAAINGGYRWDLSFAYDMDTSLGIDNTGKLVLTYGKEDDDYYVYGDPSSAYIYRAAESTFFCRLRDLFKSELQSMFVGRESQGAWSSNSLITQWDNAQKQFPEEVWRLDIQRKYLRTYLGTSIDNSIAGEKGTNFLPNMMNGRKRYQRRMFERNQELYMATKYFGTVATQDQIRIRFSNPESYVVKPNFTLHITPYSDMYLGYSFYNGHRENFRARAGVAYDINYPEGLDTADITLIYGASFIQAVDDLSACYPGADTDFSKAIRLQSLVIGSGVQGYSNSFLDKIPLTNNKLLEYLDIRNITGLKETVDLSQCGNLLELRAEGSTAKGVIFANGGKIKKFYLPSIASLTAKNLSHIEDFSIESYINLHTLVVENTPAIDTHEIVDTTFDIQSSLPEGTPKLTVLRLVGIDWVIDGADILSKAIELRGQNSNGGEIPQSVLVGKVYIPTIKQTQLDDYQEAWSDLDINHDPDGLITQYPVTFVNYDDAILDVQWVDEGGYAVDPIYRADKPISTPTKPSIVSTDYHFDGWDNPLTDQIFSALTVKATYSETVRQYTIRYVMSEGGKTTVFQETKDDYGKNVTYKGEIPTYTAKEGENGWSYYLFNRWDKSGFIDGDKTVTAVFDTFKYTEGAFAGRELSELSPVEIYALSKLTEPIDKSLSDYGMNIDTGDDFSFTMGYDVEYDDIESEELISSKRTFTGTTSDYYDTNIPLFDTDKDFVIAIDYKMSSNNTRGATLMQCYDTTDSDGFKLSYDTSPILSWGGSATVSPSGNNEREMLIIRHKQGDNNLYVYTSNLTSSGIQPYTIVRNSETITNNPSATLIFGAAKAAGGRIANPAIGEIYWCKIWYKDLGEDVCKNLASWTHEKITVEVSGFNRYQLYDDASKESMMSLLGTHLLSITRSYNSKGNDNDGGWADCELNAFLNSRFYNAIPYQIRALIKKVSVKSTIGNNSTVTSSSGCFINIPALRDVHDSAGDPYKEAYSAELYDFASTINYMTEDSDRIRKFDDSSANDAGVRYLLRSPSIGTWATSRYCYSISATGAPQSVTGTGGTGDKYGILIEISF